MLTSVRPALKPGLLPVWRDRNTLQIGIDPRRAVALTGMAGLACVISLLDGSRDRMQVLQAAGERGVPAATAERVLTLLAAGGALDDFPAGTLRTLGQSLRSGLAAELATVSLARQDGDGGARTLARRRAAFIRMHGSGRIAAAIAGILAAAGVGLVSGGTEPAATPPAGRSAARSGNPPPGRRPPARRPADGGLPDLAVIVGNAGPELSAALMSDHTPHLSAAASEAIGVVGPFVAPGRTACLRCLDFTRTDLDPAWPVILAQLAGREPIPLACDAPLAAAVAAQAASQALAFVDRAAFPEAVTNGTLELVLPSWQWRRRTWLPHQRCSCGSHPPP
jgi:bacteriocin biosynthesis cyclodehydratase domain-containing protein